VLVVGTVAARGRHRGPSVAIFNTGANEADCRNRPLSRTLSLESRDAEAARILD
jgi:hypothetical protein